MKKIFLTFLSFFLTALTLPINTFAATDKILSDCSGGTKGINTAIGCIPFDNQEAFVGWVLRWGIGIGGGVAFILILIAGFMITTSQGDPKKLQAGRELLTSAIGGLILLIFSVFVLRVIGVDILGLPNFAA